MSQEATQLPAKAKEALTRNNISFDVTTLAQDHGFIRDMNEIDMACAFALHETGCPEAAAALLQVSIGQTVTASRRPSVQRLIKILIKSDLHSSGIKKAYDALVEVIDDNGETATARNRAAETLLKWSGEIGKEQDRELQDDLSSMSIGELEGAIKQLEDKKAELSKNVIAVKSN